MTTDRLRVAFFVDNFYPQFNGVLTSYMNTVRELVRRGHEVFIVAPKIASRKRYDPKDFPYPLLYRRGIPAFFYPDFRLTPPFSLTSLLHIRRFAADIIHFHSPLTVAMQGIATARLLGIPLIGTFHTFFAEREYLRVVGLEDWDWLVRAGWWYNNLFYNACAVVVSPSRWTAEELRLHGVRSRIEVIPNGIEFSRYAAFSPRGSLPVYLPEGAEIVLYVGRVSREKCLEVLIEAMRHLVVARPQAHLVIVGDGPARDELMALVRAYGLETKVTFTGFIRNEELLSSGLLGRAKVFATPSTSENQPMTILEAMIFGLPIVGVAARGVPELIADNGFVCPPGEAKTMAEAIGRILADEGLRAKMGAASRRMVQEYSIEKTTEKLINVYREAIAEKKRRPKVAV
ncbi:MAG: glycosyltransferase family 4 protein [Firmicutes bacterium]|nr:glycosyltransferase family 4 protein [Bacillota bacterium]